MILGPQEFKRYEQEDGTPVSFEHVASDGTRKKTGETLRPCPLTADDTEKKGDHFVWKDDPSIRVSAKAEKMSKSRGNVVNPDDVVKAYGADSLRLYEMFMGPLEQVKPWSMQGVEGVHRFLRKVWRLYLDDRTGEVAGRIQEVEAGEEQNRLLHATIKKVTEDTEGMRFNTAIAGMMEFINAAQKWETLPRPVADAFLLLLSPYAPHLAEELWQRLGHTDTLAYETWPEHDEAWLKQDRVDIMIQVNGKMRGRCQVAADAGQDEVLLAAKSEVRSQLDGKTVRKEIYVPGKLVNIVLG
jgi:leucyl-tRNA synthetase